MTQMLRLLPRPVISARLTRQGEFPWPHTVYRAASSQLAAAEAAPFRRDPGPREAIDRAHIAGPGEREIAPVGAIRTLAIILPLDDLGDQAVEVQIALAMSMRPEIHLNPVDIGGKIRPVIEVEAAQEILIGLAAARVLRGDHTRHGLQQFGGTQQRAHQKVAARYRPFTGGMGDADLGLGATKNKYVAGEVRPALTCKRSGLGFIPMGVGAWHPTGANDRPAQQHCKQRPCSSRPHNRPAPLAIIAFRHSSSSSFWLSAAV